MVRVLETNVWILIGNMIIIRTCSRYYINIAKDIAVSIDAGMNLRIWANGVIYKKSMKISLLYS